MKSLQRIFIGLLILTLHSFSAFSSHIVGGSLHYTYLSTNRFLVELEYYKDCSPSAVDYPPGNLRIGIYGKSTNSLVSSFDLIPGKIHSVDFLAGNCIASPVSCVQKRVYADTLLIDTSLFKDPLGYYMSYEQCCRNYGIKNIDRPDNSGIVYYADFPAIIQNAQFFINSSPVLNQEQNLYLCAGEDFYSDYSHNDIDGDSLVYRLVEPLKGSTDNVINNSNGISILNPGPYQVIDWANSYGMGLNNIMDGNPDISIDSLTGEVYVNPQQAGLYSFAISIEEYRKGVYIGATRREIQYQVIFCPVRHKPEIAWQNPDDKVLKANATQCFQFTGFDTDAGDSLVASIYDVSSILAQQNITFSFDTLQQNPINIEVCVTTNCDVPNSNAEGFKIVINDGSCPKPKTDTFHVYLEITSLDLADPLKNVPNVFTPNKDGLNDYFTINKVYPASCIENFSIVIYNRWGEQVFESTDFAFKWFADGLPNGVYFYVIKLDNREKAGNILVLF